MGHDATAKRIHAANERLAETDRRLGHLRLVQVTSSPSLLQYGDVTFSDEEVRQIRSELADRPVQGAHQNPLLRNWQLIASFAVACVGFGSVGFQVNAIADLQRSHIERLDSMQSRITRLEAEHEVARRTEDRFRDKEWPRIREKMEELLGRVQRIEELVKRRAK